MFFKKNIEHYPFHILFFLFQILSKLSIEKLYFLSKILHQFINYSFRYRKKIITKNLQKAFPKKSKTQIKKIRKKFYAYLLDVIVETIKLIDFNANDLVKRIEILNPELITKERRKEKPIIIISGHYSNWEWLLATICVYWKKNIYAIYKPLSNTFFNKLIFKIRTKFGAKMLKHKSSAKFILKNKLKPNIYFFLSDQVPESINHSHQSYFLKIKTSFSTGVERLSKKTNATVFYAEMKKIDKGRYTIKFLKISNNITEKYVRELEKTLLKSPENWLWSHNRWKR